MKRILVVDDEIGALTLIGIMLERGGFEVLKAKDADQALSVLEHETPDLIILDVMMPGMDGYEVARRLRFNTVTASIPILMFTAKAQLDDKVTGFEAGADDYLTKPTHPAELQAHVKALLARSKKATPVNPPTTPTEPTAHTIGVLTARSGQGATTVAINLAASMLKRSKGDVILAEFRPGQGTMGTELGLASTGMGLTGLLKSTSNEITRTRLREELLVHASGLKVLPASYQPRDAALSANTAQFGAILQALSFLSAFVVVDFGPGLPDFTQTLAKNLSDIVIVCEPSAQATMHAQAMINDLVEMGVKRDRLIVVGNSHAWLNAPMPPAQLKEQFGLPVGAYLLAVPELVATAGRSKTPVVLAQPDSPFSKQITTLANQLLDRAPKSHRR